MRHLLHRMLVVFVASILAFCSSNARPAGNAVAAARKGSSLAERFGPPPGCELLPAANGSFGETLRNLPLKPDGSEVHDHTGRVVDWGAGMGAVLDIDLVRTERHSDLQQCADLAVRLWAEHRWQQRDVEALSFTLQNGQALSWKDWRTGVRGSVVGDRHIFINVASKDRSYAGFRAYLAYVMTWLGSAGMKDYATPVEPNALQPGDLFVQNNTGAIGHVTVVADVCVRGDERRLLVVQSYMPAQEGHVVLPADNEGDGAWFSLEGLRRHQSRFGPGVFRRLP